MTGFSKTLILSMIPGVYMGFIGFLNVHFGLHPALCTLMGLVGGIAMGIYIAKWTCHG